MLEIIIPSYNRNIELRNTLQKIADSSFRSYKITVIDNQSPSSYEDLIDHFVQKNNLNLNLIRNRSNIGAGGNLMKAYEIAEEEYLWVLCDDDNLDLSEADKILEEIKQKKSDLYIVGSPIGGNVLEEFDSKVCGVYSSDELCETEFLRILTFTPSSIVKNSLIKKCDFKYAYEHFHTFFPQMFWIKECVKSNWSVYVPEKYLVTRPPIDIGLESDFTHLNGYLKASQQFPPEIKKHFVSLYFGEKFIKFFAFLVARESMNMRFSYENFWIFFSLANNYQKFISLLILPITFLPPSFLKIIKRLKKTFFN